MDKSLMQYKVRTGSKVFDNTLFNWFAGWFDSLQSSYLTKLETRIIVEPESFERLGSAIILKLAHQTTTRGSNPAHQAILSGPLHKYSDIL